MKIERLRINIECFNLKNIKLKKDIKIKNIFCFVFHDLIYQGIVSSFILTMILYIISQSIYEFHFSDQTSIDFGIAIWIIIVVLKLVGFRNFYIKLRD